MQAELEKLRRFKQKSDSAVNKVANNQVPNRPDHKFITPRINCSKVRLQLDSASDISIISAENWKKLGKPALSPSKILPGSAIPSTFGDHFRAA